MLHYELAALRKRFAALPFTLSVYIKLIITFLTMHIFRRVSHGSTSTYRWYSILKRLYVDVGDEKT